LSWIAQSEGFDYDVLVIGSGFGGSVSALRLTEKGYRVGVLEAGRRFADDEFACGRSRTSSIICPSRSSTPARIRSWTRRDQRIRVLLEHLGRSTLAPTRVAGRGVPAGEPDDRPATASFPWRSRPRRRRSSWPAESSRQPSNDMVLVALVLAVRDWNESVEERVSGRTSVLMPVNMRPAEQLLVVGLSPRLCRATTNKPAQLFRRASTRP
jgi:choline dehydrogenase-like flavoprotein